MISNREISHIVLATNSRTKKLYFDNYPEFITYLESNNEFFDIYPANLTIYCHSTEHRRKIRKDLETIRKTIEKPNN